MESNETYYDPAFAAVIDYANASGYQLPSKPYLDAINRWIRAMKAQGRFNTKNAILYNFANDGDDDFRTLNYIDPTKYKCSIQGNLTRTPLGYEGNNVDAYLTTGFSPATQPTPYTLNDASRGAYIYKAFTADNVIDGVTALSNNSMRNTVSVAQWLNAGASNNLPQQIDLGGTGFKFLSRDSAGTVKGINNGVETAVASASTTLANLVQCIFKSGETGYGDAGISCYMMGASINADQSLNVNAAFEVYLIEVGLLDSPASFDPAFATVINYATVQGYRLPTKPYRDALNRWVRAMRAQGRLSTKNAILYNFANDGDDNFRTLNYIDPAQYKCTMQGNLTPTPLGYEGNNVDAYLTTGFNPTIQVTPYILNDACRGAYIYKAFTADNVIDGVTALSNNSMRNTASVAQWINAGAGNNLPQQIDLGGTGFKFLSRDSVANVKGINNGVETVVASASTTLANLVQCIFKSGETGYGDAGISCYMMGASINADQAIGVNVALETYLLEVGLKPPINYDPAFAAVINYANASGYQLPSKPYLDAINRWIRAMKAQGRFNTKNAILYNFANDGDDNFRTLNYIDPTKYKCSIQGNLTRTPLGYEGNNVDAYLTTGFSPATQPTPYTLNDASRGAYIYKAFTADTVIDGVTALSNNSMRNTASVAQWLNAGAGNNLPQQIDLGGTGFKFLSRDSAGTVKGINNGVETAVASASTTLANLIQCIFKSGETGYGDAGISCYMMGASINADQSLNVNAAFEVYLIEVGLLDPPASFDPAFATVINYATVQGYRLPTKSYRDALNRWVRAMRAQGRLSTKNAILYNFANDGDDDFRTLNYIDPTKYKCTIQGNLTSTPLGYEGNNVDAYLTTGFSPATQPTPYTLNDASRGAYIYKAFTADNVIDGVTAVSNNSMRNTASLAQWLNAGAGNNLPQQIDLGGTGFKFISRDSVANVKGINNGEEIVVASASTTLANLVQCIFKSGETGYGDAGISCYMMGASINADQALNVNIALETYLLEANLIVPQGVGTNRLYIDNLDSTDTATLGYQLIDVSTNESLVNENLSNGQTKRFTPIGGRMKLEVTNNTIKSYFIDLGGITKPLHPSTSFVFEDIAAGDVKVGIYTYDQIPRFGFAWQSGSFGGTLSATQKVQIIRDKRASFMRITVSLKAGGVVANPTPQEVQDATSKALELNMEVIYCIRSLPDWVKDLSELFNITFIDGKDSDLPLNEQQMAAYIIYLQQKHHDVYKGFATWIKTFNNSAVRFEVDNEPELFKNLLRTGKIGNSAADFNINKVNAYIPAIAAGALGLKEGFPGCRVFSPANAGNSVAYLYDRICGTKGVYSAPVNIPTEVPLDGYNFHLYSNLNEKRNNSHQDGAWFPGPGYHTGNYLTGTFWYDSILTYWADRYQKPMILTETNYWPNAVQDGNDQFSEHHQQKQIDNFNSIYTQMLNTPSLECMIIHTPIQQVDRSIINEYSEATLGWEGYDLDANGNIDYSTRKEKKVNYYVRRLKVSS